MWEEARSKNHQMFFGMVQYKGPYTEGVEVRTQPHRDCLASGYDGRVPP